MSAATRSESSPLLRPRHADEPSFGARHLGLAIGALAVLGSAAAVVAGARGVGFTPYLGSSETLIEATSDLGYKFGPGELYNQPFFSDNDVPEGGIDLVACPSAAAESGIYQTVYNCLGGGSGCLNLESGCRDCTTNGDSGQYPNWLPICPCAVCAYFGLDYSRCDSDCPPPPPPPALPPSPPSTETPETDEDEGENQGTAVTTPEDDHETEEVEAPVTTTEASEPGTSNDGSQLPATIDPFPATCSFSRSGYNPATDTCASGTHISQLTKVDLGQGYWAYADATGHKLIPIDEGGSAGATVPYGSSLTTILGACTAKDGCRAIATDERQTSWMKSTECMSPCFRTYVNWYMAFNEESPSPFNPDRAESQDDHEAEEEEAPVTTTGASPDGSQLPATIDPFPATCLFSRSGYNPATDTCASGTHISELTKVDLGQGYWAYADATGHKLIPIDEGGSAGATVPYGSSLTTILGACTAKDGCRAIATDERQTSWMKSTECMSPCFRTYVNWYMAFNDESPSPFNPDRQS